MTPTDRWWETAFGPHYRTVYAHRDDASATEEASFAADALGLSGGSRVLDAGCGDGRHARALAARGVPVFGLDRSPDLLADARRRGGGPRYILGDLRALPFRGTLFDAVLSFFTSFGYFGPEGDAGQLREFRRVLREGAGFLVDFLNAPSVATSLVEESSRTVGDLTVVERRAIRRGCVEKDVEVRRASAEPVRWRESVRLYSREEVESMLRTASLVPRAVHGDLRGGAWSPAAARLVVVGRAA